VIEILKRLPGTNCRVCGEPTCRGFAARLAEGAKGVEACQPLTDAQRQALEGYMARFNLVD
jgi:ArsR family metal-binding transcriptional regulator